MLIKAYYKCDINRCTNTHESNDTITSYGNYMERPRAHTFKQMIPHLGTEVPDYFAEETIDICQDHYDLIREGKALLYMKDKKPRLRRVRVQEDKNVED